MFCAVFKALIGAGALVIAEERLVRAVFRGDFFRRCAACWLRIPIIECKRRRITTFQGHSCACRLQFLHFIGEAFACRHQGVFDAHGFGAVGIPVKNRAAVIKAVDIGDAVCRQIFIGLRRAAGVCKDAVQTHGNVDHDRPCRTDRANRADGGQV